MPQIREKYFGNDSVLGLWMISEGSEELAGRIRLSDHELEVLAGFKNETRRRQWLSYRLLIRQMLGSHDIDVRYRKSGKPFMADPAGHISVTHSGDYSAVIYSRESRVGIDIERIQQKIERVTEKFLSCDEINALTDTANHQELVTLWAAKESLYKLAGRRNIDFIRDLYIEPFVPADQGTLQGAIRMGTQVQRVRLSFEKISDYMLVWVLDQTLISSPLALKK